MLVTLAEMKSSLGLTATTYDTFLTEQLSFISDVVEAYCGRKFEEANYRQTFYFDDFGTVQPTLMLAQYPVSEITKIEEDSVAITDYRLQSPTGTLIKREGFFSTGDTLVIEYAAGFATVPSIIKQSVIGIVTGRYNKKVSGLALDFGSDVQAISIPGVINVQFDYTLDFNQRKSAYGAVIGSYSNMLDPFRSERSTIGSGKLEFLEVLP